MTEIIQQIAIWAVPVIFAVTVHEAAHGYVAKYFGDNTAAEQGRLTLNPINHVDPVGTIAVPAFLLAMGGFLFGWAKPVPVNFARLKRPKRDMALVALAGPGVNLLMAVIWAIGMRIAVAVDPSTTIPALRAAMRLGLDLTPAMAAVPAGSSTTWALLALVCFAGVMINLVLMLLNLLPIPPLDGSRVVAGVAPATFVRPYMKLEPYGLLILVALLLTGLLGAVLWPMIFYSRLFLFSIVGLA